MILLGCCSCGAKNINKKYILKGINKSNYNWCTTSYMISKKFAKQILNIIENRKIYCGIDVYYIMNIYSKYDYYIANLPFIKQNKSLESDITMGELGNNIKIEF
jgi:GR25 family glycosyltransferase involved in LPS biosynthesis